MAWKEISKKRKFFKFENEGDELVGRWLGISTGQFGPIGTIENDDGEQLSFTINKALEDLAQVPLGAMLKLVLAGWVESKDGNKYKDYRKFIDEDSPPGTEITAPADDAPHAEDSLEAVNEDVPPPTDEHYEVGTF
jgi:hypothetical protein